MTIPESLLPGEFPCCEPYTPRHAKPATVLTVTDRASITQEADTGRVHVYSLVTGIELSNDDDC
jgi:hypothetical protein